MKLSTIQKTYDLIFGAIAGIVLAIMVILFGELVLAPKINNDDSSEELHINRGTFDDGLEYGVPESRQVKLDPRSMECLIEAIYFESGNQKFKGMMEVGFVIRNRVEDSRYPDTYCDVIHQPNQFSYLNFKRRPMINAQVLRYSKIAAKAVMIDTTVRDKTLLWYHADYIKHPTWTKNMKLAYQVGNHIFYGDSI